MGAHYRSIQIKHENRGAIISAVQSLLSPKEGRALIGPVINGWIGIYANDEAGGENFTNNLAARLKADVLDLMVHDSDIFFYNYYRDGDLVDEYSSSPDYFEKVSKAEHQRLQGKPEVFRDLIGSDKKLTELETLLKVSDDTEEFLFEENRLEKLAKLFGIENTFASYDYLMNGEWDGIEGWKQFIHIPDLTAEKNAAKAVAAALRAEKNQLKKRGLLCFETQPPAKAQIAVGQMAFDPVNGGLLFNWGGRVAHSSEPRLFYSKPPWTSEPEPVEVPASSQVPTDLVFSKTGKWFACSDGNLRLWLWSERKLSEKTKAGCWPVQFSTDEKSLLCQTRQGFEILSLETSSVVQTAVLSSDPSTRFRAWHPSGKYLVTRPRQDQLGLVDLQAGKVLKVLFSGTICDWSQLLGHFAGKLSEAGIQEDQLVEMKHGMIRGSDEPFSCKFSPDGRLLFCATTRGLRVLEWDKVLAAEKSTPPPLFAASVMPLQSPMKPHEGKDYINYVYDVVFDEQKNRLLFCGIEGVIRYFNLNDASTGILLKPPGNDSICQLQLSADREFICSSSIPPFGEGNKKPRRIQVWNYRLLETAAGLE